MKKGFTLIELIGVVILLSIIMIIVFPTLLNHITNTNKELSESEKQIIYSGTSNYIAKYQNNYEKINGNIYCIEIDELLKEQVIHNNLMNRYQYVQVVVNQDQYQYEIKDTCTPDYLISLNYVVIGEPFNQNNWAKSDFYVDIVALGATKIKWCSSNNGECDPIAEVEKEKVPVLISNESATNQICAIAYVNNHEKEKVCSNVYRLDKTPPQFVGIDDKAVYLDNEFKVSEGVTISDNLSGLSGNYISEPNAIDNTKIAKVEVIYSAIDQAGNKARIVRNIDVKNPYNIYVTNNSITVYDLSTYNEQTKLIDAYTLFFQSEITLSEYETQIYISNVFPNPHLKSIKVPNSIILEDSLHIDKFYNLKNKAEQYNQTIENKELMPNFSANDLLTHILTKKNYTIETKNEPGYYYSLYRKMTAISDITSHNTTLKNGTAVSVHYSLVKSTLKIEGDMNKEYQLVCEWSEWISVSFPQYGPQYGDYETYENIKNAGIDINKDNVVNLQCRPAKFPNYSHKEIGQKVICDRRVGFICHNKEQVPGPAYPVDMCLNSEIKVYSCEMVESNSSE